jgi:hypothetical protein
MNRTINIDEYFDLYGIDAVCTCECGCREPVQVLSENQKLNCQCPECHYSHR